MIVIVETHKNLINVDVLIIRNVRQRSWVRGIIL